MFTIKGNRMPELHSVNMFTSNNGTGFEPEYKREWLKRCLRIDIYKWMGKSWTEIVQAVAVK